MSRSIVALLCSFFFCLLPNALSAATSPGVPEHKPIRLPDLDCDLHIVSTREKADGPRILAVVAHPDDECGFAGTLFKTATHLNGVCDIAMITNGEGGFKYSTLAEAVYGRPLTDEEVGRMQLPQIRRHEFLSGCKIMNIRHAYMFMEKDHRFTLDTNEILGPDAKVWDLDRIQKGLKTIMLKNNYDYVLVFTPVPNTHAHHKCASILAIRTIAQLPADKRPVILGQRSYTEGVALEDFPGLEGFPETVYAEQGPYTFDRNQTFGYKQRLNYKIIVNWVIAEHKSQGTMQLLMHKGDQEWYYPFSVNDPKKDEQTKAFFKKLAEPQYEEKTYGPSAGAPRPSKDNK